MDNRNITELKDSLISNLDKNTKQDIFIKSNTIKIKLSKEQNFLKNNNINEDVKIVKNLSNTFRSFEKSNLNYSKTSNQRYFNSKNI